MQLALIIIVSIFLIIAILFLIAKQRMRNIPLAADHKDIITLTDKNFGHQTKNRTMLVDFWAAWCAPCKLMAPVINDLAGDLKGSYHVGKVDIEKNQALAKKYQVRSIPTFILFKDGIEINRFSGMKNKEFMLKQIQNIK